MKKQLTLLFLLYLGLTLSTVAQSPVSDLVIVGAISGDQNMKQIEMRYNGKPNVFFTGTSALSGIEQITIALEGRKINDLHIFVKSTFQGLFFSDGSVTSENVRDFTTQLSTWKEFVAGQVVIHNQTGVASPELNDLLGKLKELSGLEFELKQ